LEEVWDGSRKPFNRVESRNVMEATDILFNKALSSIQAAPPPIIGTIYEDLKKHWTHNRFIMAPQPRYARLSLTIWSCLFGGPILTVLSLTQRKKPVVMPPMRR